MRHYPALLGVVEEMLQGPSDTYLLGLRPTQSAMEQASLPPPRSTNSAGPHPPMQRLSVPPRAAGTPAVVRQWISIFDVKVKSLELIAADLANEHFEAELKDKRQRRRYQIAFVIVMSLKAALLIGLLVARGPL
jgi:hypothetical protein